MSTGSKVFLGIMTFLPIVAVIALIIFWVSFIVSVVDAPYSASNDQEMTQGFIKFGIGIAVTALLSIGLTIFYAVHAWRNQRMNESNRTAWLLINIFGGTIAHLIYFFMHITPKHAEPIEKNYQYR